MIGLDLLIDHLSIAIFQHLIAGDKGLALSPTINVNDTWLASRPNNAPHDIFLAVIHFLMLSKCTVYTQFYQQLAPLSRVQSDIRYEGEISRTQVLPLVAALADDSTIARKREDNGVLLAMMVHCRFSMRFGNHARGADIRSQPNESIGPYHAFGLPTRDF